MQIEYPTRQTNNTEFPEQKAYEGIIKIRLGHSNTGSVLVPEQLLIKSGRWHFYQPSTFCPPVLCFGIEKDLHIADFVMDVCSPNGIEATPLKIRIFSNSLIKQSDDGAQYYKCQVTGPKRISKFSAGKCHVSGNTYFLHLFHHTTAKGKKDINNSQVIWGSTWNLQGTRKLKNVCYAYFTSLSCIKSEIDLNRIAMASNGQILLQTTSDRSVEKQISLTVYRENSSDRSSKIGVHVPDEIISIPHLRFHPPTRHGPAYYEVVSPEIFRVGMGPKEVLSIPMKQAKIEKQKVKGFAYIILGDASTLDGLTSPYDEENTKQTMHLEKLNKGIDIFEFWQENQNTDQTSNKNPEARQLEK